MAATGNAGRGGVEHPAVGHDRAGVGGEHPGQRLHAAGRAHRAPAPRQQGHPGADVELEAGQAVGGHAGAGGDPPAEPRIAGIGHADRGRHVAGQVGQQHPEPADDRARTSARADATTVVPAPPFTDQQEISTRPPQDTPAGAQNQGPGEAVPARIARANEDRKGRAAHVTPRPSGQPSTPTVDPWAEAPDPDGDACPATLRSPPGEAAPTDESRIGEAGASSEERAPELESKHSAAFFDLDKTVIAKASMVAFGKPLYRAGLVSRWLLLRALYGQLVYLYLGADEDRMATMRESVLRVTKGWDRAHVASIVRETLDEVIEPIVFDEALDLIREHRAAGRRVFIVSASPEEIVAPLAHHLGVHEAIAHAGRDRRPRPLHGPGRLLLLRALQGRGHARDRRDPGHRPRPRPTPTRTRPPTSRCSRRSAIRWR